VSKPSIRNTVCPRNSAPIRDIKRNYPKYCPLVEFALGRQKERGIDEVIKAKLKAGISKDQIFLFIKRSGVEISAHRLRHKISLAYLHMVYGKEVVI